MTSAAPSGFPVVEVWRRVRRPARWLAVAAAWAFGGWDRGTAADLPAHDLVPVTMLVGFTPSGVVHGNRNDVEAAFKVLCETIGRTRGFLVTAKIRIFQDAATFHAAISAGEINFAVFDSFSYLGERRRSKLSPAFIPATKGSAVRRYLLLVRREGDLRTMDDLRGKRLVELEAPNVSVGNKWLQRLLLAQGARTPGEFFSSVQSVDRASAAVLPVFFGKQDVCLVDELGFKLMEELNPQVGRRLLAIEVSEPLAGSVICVSESNWSVPQFRAALIGALGELHLEPAGRQMLDLFKVDRMEPYQEHLLDTAQSLWAATAEPLPEVAR